MTRWTRSLRMALWLCMCLCPLMLCFFNLFCFPWWVFFLSCRNSLIHKTKAKEGSKTRMRICWWYRTDTHSSEGTTSPDCPCPGPISAVHYLLDLEEKTIEFYLLMRCFCFRMSACVQLLETVCFCWVRRGMCALWGQSQAVRDLSITQQQLMPGPWGCRRALSLAS